MERIVEEIREDLDRRIALAADRLTDRTLAREPAWAVPLGRAGVRERIRLVLRRILDGLVGAGRGEPVDVAAVRLGLPERGRFAVVVLAPSRPGTAGPSGTGWGVHGPGASGPDAAGPGSGVSGSGVPGSGVSGAGVSGAGASGAGLPGSGVPGPGLPGTGLPGTGLPGDPGAGSCGAGGAADGPAGVPGAPRVLWRVRADGETGVAELGHHPLESLRALLAPLPVRAGISPVVGSPAELAGARRLAALALRAAPAPAGSGACLLDERLPAALVAADPELAARLREVVLGPVLALPGQEARVLLTTLGTWLACQGSTTYAAQRLYCHRNTVSNRLRRLEQLTGRTLSDPAHVVDLALAHAALAHAPAKAGPPPVDPAAGGGGPTPAGTARRSPRSPG
ncbi:helix-turn-helix domain-containing protein [Streptomyces sp. NPDC006670]|uniref:helix-turn-helix domain-containing protein n=1 Tax=Streptomyces sp. NPDC006670 TaxID=3154476 RepID=UPI0033CE3852